MKIARLSAAVVLMLPLAASTQTIQRCEDAHQRISYSNAVCPAGTKPVKALPPAPQPSAQSRAAAQAKLQRYREKSKSTAKTSARTQPAAAAPQDAVRKAADCGYLQASIDSSRRLRNVLTTRPYYSTEDVEEADARTTELIAEYRRVCGS